MALGSPTRTVTAEVNAKHLLRISVISKHLVDQAISHWNVVMAIPISIYGPELLLL